MKEVSGELNSTVVVVIAVASLTTFFYYAVWPLIKSNLNSNAKCSQAICNKCESPTVCEKVTCHVKGDPGNTFECVWKG